MDLHFHHTEDLGHYRFRLAGMSDFAPLRELYTGETRHHAVYIRDEALVKDSIQRDLYQIIESPTGEIVGATASYPLSENLYHEIGSTRMTEGFGAYEPLIASQMVMAFLRCPPTRFVMADVQKSEVGVIKKLTGPVLQWREFAPDADLIDMFRGTVDPSDANLDNPKLFFQCPVSAIPSVAEYLLGFGSSRRLVNGRGDKSIEYSLTHMTALHDNLKSIVAHRELMESQPFAASWRETAAEFRQVRVRAASSRPEWSGEAFASDFAPVVSG